MGVGLACGASVKPDEEGTQFAVHGPVVLEPDDFAPVECCFDAFSEVGLRGVEPAVNILLPHVDSLLIKEHHPVQLVAKRLQQLAAYGNTTCLVSG